MDLKKSLFDPIKSDTEVLESFKKLIQINHIHQRNRQITFQYVSEDSNVDNRDEFYNFVSIIIKPEDNKSIKEFLYNLYERFDFTFLMSFFSKDYPDEFKNLDLDSILKLKEILSHVG